MPARFLPVRPCRSASACGACHARRQAIGRDSSLLERRRAGGRAGGHRNGRTGPCARLRDDGRLGRHASCCRRQKRSPLHRHRRPGSPRCREGRRNSTGRLRGSASQGLARDNTRIDAALPGSAHAKGPGGSSAARSADRPSAMPVAARPRLFLNPVLWAHANQSTVEALTHRRRRPSWLVGIRDRGRRAERGRTARYAPALRRRAPRDAREPFRP